MVSHKDLFYQTRSSVPVTNSDPSKAPTANLNHVPTEAEVSFDTGEVREVKPELFDDHGDGYEVAQFLIGRAMLDPDATVREL